MPERQSGRLTITSIDLLWFREDSNLYIWFRRPTFYPVELRNLFVIPERFELSTPDLKDRCSNHLSYEIIFLCCEWSMINWQFALLVNFKFTWNKIHIWLFTFCNPRRTRTFSLWFRRPTLYPIEPWDCFYILWMVNRQFVLLVNFEFTWNKIHYWLFTFLGYLRGSNPVLRCHKPTLYQIS